MYILYSKDRTTCVYPSFARNGETVATTSGACTFKILYAVYGMHIVEKKNVHISSLG